MMMDVTEVDVLIIGGGSAGLCAGVWLARSGISYRILERRSGMLTNGQADGVQVRTVEIFESFGLSEELLKEAYHVLEDTFWSDDAEEGKPPQQQQQQNGIRRTHSTPDTEAGLSHLPHVILNQARINALLTGAMERASGATNIEYGCDVRDVVLDDRLLADPDAFCITVTAMKGGVERVYKAKYALGSDGAHSQVRKSLGFKMLGDSTDEVWGVMDVYPRTNFPDIRKKAIVKSKSGNIIVIPREGDSLARMYINLSGGATAAKDVTLAQLHEKAQQIFQPYTMEFPGTDWWSAYVIGQRLANEFHLHHRIFLSGDACHTHSPKAGQGMNVSLQDGYNIGWKLASVLRGRAAPSLLRTYVLERQKTASDLIDFDRYWSKLFSTTTTTSTSTTTTTAAAAAGGGAQKGGMTPELFVQAGRYTAGLATRYADSLITAAPAPAPDANTNVNPNTAAAAAAVAVARNLVVGMRFPSARVVRVADARPMWLSRALPADSRWHIVVFAGDVRDGGSGGGAGRLRTLGMNLEGLVHAFTPFGGDLDSVFNIVLVLSTRRADVDIEHVPGIFTPTAGMWKLKNILKVFAHDNGDHDAHGHAYELYGIDPSQGALVVIRPDQYISRIGSLSDVRGIHSFFSKFLTR